MTRLTPAEIQKRLRDRRAAAGLCHRCGKNPLVSKGRCAMCLAKGNAERAARDKKRRAEQLCVSCGSPSPGQTLCQKCCAARSARKRQHRKQGLCYVCGKNPPDKRPNNCGKGPNTRCHECTEKANAYNQRIKDAAYSAYGGYRCVCCGIIEPEFLSIDHINGDGRKHRDKNIVGTRLYQWLKKHKYPPGFQILCHNCNWAKGHSSDGLCPHQRMR